jgi:hypothetical protein
MFSWWTAIFILCRRSDDDVLILYILFPNSQNFSRGSYSNGEKSFRKRIMEWLRRGYRWLWILKITFIWYNLSFFSLIDLVMLKNCIMLHTVPDEGVDRECIVMILDIKDSTYLKWFLFISLFGLPISIFTIDFFSITQITIRSEKSINKFANQKLDNTV